MIDHFTFIKEPSYYAGGGDIDLEFLRDFFCCSIYERIEERTVAGEAMIFIPKVYVAHRKLLGYNPCWFVSSHPREGYHLHPAFFNNGVETDNGILIGKYPASVEMKDGSFATYATIGDTTNIADIHSLDQDTSNAIWQYSLPDPFEVGVALKNSDPSDADSSGWHLCNIYEHALLQRLALIPTNTTELDVLYQPFGLVFTPDGYNDKEWLYGAGLVKSGDNFYWRILNSTQSAFVTTEAQVVFEEGKSSASGYARYLHEEVGEDYDTRDLFLPKNVSFEYDYLQRNPADAFFGLDTPYEFDKPDNVFYPYVRARELRFHLTFMLFTQVEREQAFARIAKFC